MTVEPRAAPEGYRLEELLGEGGLAAAARELRLPHPTIS
jgi:hypothetical protein